ncbi:transposase [Clostridium zeae]|uniref:Transposase n=1 Tax=Clostridium zeae TaxID=2759022 RepID=A0ABQ1EIB5_9CLOT|nr:Rpn family recombination-promoting nuclease/putative transposase [Clostridium zeae]GFZ34449.1 transposase [Clostridium zeae]
MISKNGKFNIDTNRFDDDFIMSPKVDFVFKLIFGDEKNKDVLIAFLSAALKLDKEEFKEIELLNTELLREFKEDKKGILDIRVKTKNNENIDIEIQILPTEFMAERTLFYWSKMYNSQISPGDTYDKLKKCITINIVDFERIPIDKIHTRFHILEDETLYKLTDVLEIHFLELPKLAKIDKLKDIDDPILEWLEFIDAKSKEGMEMLAEKNENIKTAYEILQRVSKSKEARMAYEARQAEIMDQLTREKSAREDGIKEGIEKEKIAIAQSALLMNLPIEQIEKLTGLPIEKIRELKN